MQNDIEIEVLIKAINKNSLQAKMNNLQSKTGVHQIFLKMRKELFYIFNSFNIFNCMTLV